MEAKQRIVLNSDKSLDNSMELWWNGIQEKYGGKSQMELARWYLAKRAMGQKLGVVSTTL